MGIQPGEWRRMTTCEMVDVYESWTEAQGGVSWRQQRRASTEFERLKQHYPYTDCAEPHVSI